MDIEKKYIGIPEELIHEIFYREKEFRILVEYNNGDVFVYNWIKYTSENIKSEFLNYFINNEIELKTFHYDSDVIKQKVKRIYIRIPNGSAEKTIKFKEIWNCESSAYMPNDELKKYSFKNYEDYLTFFILEIEFARVYLCIHYPFEYSFILNNWEFIETGSASYSVFITDTDSICSSIFGLSFNKNIRWNSKLKAKYNYGIDNPWMGYVEGTGGSPVEYDEKDYIDYIIPLDIKKEVEIRNNCSIDYWGSVIAPFYYNSGDDKNFEGPNIYPIEKLETEYPFIEVKEFNYYYETDRFMLLLNDTIWRNTLQHIIDDDFCNIIFEKLRDIEKNKNRNVDI